jgi:palmitoyl-protein thioesterase
MLYQVHYFAEILANDTNLRGGFNLIGHSQGALISRHVTILVGNTKLNRAYIERYNNPPVLNYISWVGPHDGVFGVPDFNYYCPDSDYLCDLLNYVWYL